MKNKKQISNPSPYANLSIEFPYLKKSPRDPKRISKLMSLLLEIWEKAPDLIFFQLIYTLQEKYAAMNNNYGKVINNSDLPLTGFDFFSLEDDKFEQFILENKEKLP